MQHWGDSDDRRMAVLGVCLIYLFGLLTGGGLVGLIAWMV